MIDLFIRAARPDDAPAVIAIINAVCAERIYLSTEHYVPTPQWETVLYHPEETLRQSAPGCFLLLPLVGGQIVGWCRVFGGIWPKTHHVADIGIGLLPAYRGQGIGTQLLRQAVGRAAAQGFAKLTADCFSTNLRARALFRKLGFVETGVRHRQYKINGDEIDQILLEHFLP